jgi:hypothetical protein
MIRLDAAFKQAVPVSRQKAGSPTLNQIREA